MTLRFAGSLSMPSSRSGPLRWKKLRAWLCTIWAQFISRRSFSGRGRNAHAQDGVAGFGRGQQVADRADAADARGDAGHFPEAAAFAELLEAAEFGHVEAGVGHLAVDRPDGCVILAWPSMRVTGSIVIVCA